MYLFLLIGALLLTGTSCGSDGFDLLVLSERRMKTHVKLKKNTRLAAVVNDYSERCFWRHAGSAPPVADDFFVVASHRILADFATEFEFNFPYIEGLIWTICAHGFNEKSTVDQSMCVKPTVIDCPTGCTFDHNNRVFKKCDAGQMCRDPVSGEKSKWNVEIEEGTHAPTQCPLIKMKAVVDFQTLKDICHPVYSEDLKKMHISCPLYITLAGYNEVAEIIFETSTGEDLNIYDIVKYSNASEAEGVHAVMNSQVFDSVPSTRITFEKISDGNSKIKDIKVQSDYNKDKAHHHLVKANCYEGETKYQVCTVKAQAELVRDGWLTLELYFEEDGREWMDELTRYYRYSSASHQENFEIVSNLWISPYDKLHEISNYGPGKAVIVDTARYWVLERFEDLTFGEWRRMNPDVDPSMYYRMKSGEKVPVNKDFLVWKDFTDDKEKMKEIDEKMGCDKHPCYLRFFETKDTFPAWPLGGKWKKDDVARYGFHSNTEIAFSKKEEEVDLKKKKRRQVFKEKDDVNSEEKKQTTIVSGMETAPPNNGLSIWSILGIIFGAVGAVGGGTLLSLCICFLLCCACFVFCGCVVCLGLEGVKQVKNKMIQKGGEDHILMDSYEELKEKNGMME